MKPTESWLLIFALQGAAIFFDEFYFHWRRGLPLWERLGHPMDTLTVLIPFSIALFVPFSSGALTVFVYASIFSCVFITKDEFVHRSLCTGAEQWLHAVLFILHPLALILAGLIWADSTSALRPALLFQSILIFGFLVYQIFYWSFAWRAPRSTTASTTPSAIAGTPPTTIPSHS